EPREDAAERAAVRISVGDHRQGQKPVALGRVRDHEEIVEHGRERVDHTLDDALAAKLEQRLGLSAHARAAPTRLDHARDFHYVSLASHGGAPAPRRAAARPTISLASHGGTPAPRRATARPTIASV